MDESHKHNTEEKISDEKTNTLWNHLKSLETGKIPLHIIKGYKNKEINGKDKHHIQNGSYIHTSIWCNLPRFLTTQLITKNLSGQIRFFSVLILCNHSETFDTGNNPFILETLTLVF